VKLLTRLYDPDLWPRSWSVFVGFIALTPGSLQAWAPSIAVAAGRPPGRMMLDRSISRQDGGNDNVYSKTVG